MEKRLTPVFNDSYAHLNALKADVEGIKAAIQTIRERQQKYENKETVANVSS